MSNSTCSFSYDLTSDLNMLQSFTFKTQGSEAKIYEGTFLEKPAILKERFEKKYRHPDLDRTLAWERTKAEARAVHKCQEIGIPCPAILFADLGHRCIVFQKIPNAITVKEYLHSVIAESGPAGINLLFPLAHKIGEGIAKMHRNELVHGDLTTSNLLINEHTLKKPITVDQEYKVYYIDFGLSKRDIVAEDMAVDLYVLERAISSSHPNSDKFYEAVLKKYFGTLGKKASAVSEKLEEVRLRGRKRSMVG